jgi:hypothetical protein
MSERAAALLPLPFRSTQSTGPATDSNRWFLRIFKPLLTMLQFDCDLAEEWFLKLWEATPTPADAVQLIQAQVQDLLKSHRIRRIGAAKVLGILNQPALTVAPKRKAEFMRPKPDAMTAWRFLSGNRTSAR